ncbi:class I SAM-dependent methyltransferase [Prochlorococcus sp. MIT 1303]|uniref:class I SAM-dependent methyltransferase n=1 Tax=Prochlorococcus sp. MIT 1303 TaxID=1723647 RepID=UPI0007B3AFFE|nr:class I SAM-dependent methyltransferase [Prochlorococcus sp. MIT 1303]KZR70347.1 Macrocin-O-methyltransferase (TylF) [Prochlorococcus sp. MIT 1303]
MSKKVKREFSYKAGELETSKHEHRRSKYYEGLEIMKNMPYGFEEHIHDFPCFVGSLTMARFFSLKDCYDKTLGIAGHIADVGVFRGASMFFFSKLVELYEPTTLTQVHGFDWFQGNNPSSVLDKDILPSSSSASYENVSKLISANNLENIIRLHKLDLTNDLPDFFDKYSHLQFRLVFLDTGTYNVVINALPFFWERLSKGGIIIIDTYNIQHTPGETKAVNEFFSDKNIEIRTFKNGWIPTAYIQK